MERLTIKSWRNLDPWETCGQDNFFTRGCHEKGGCNNGCIVPKLYGRLAAYEDTGMEPEEIRYLGDLREMKREIIFGVTSERLKELAEADKEGRLVVMPCKVGDTVFRVFTVGTREPVWVQSPGIPEYGRWAIVEGVGENCLFLHDDFTCHDYGKTWLAYRQKQEEETK